MITQISVEIMEFHVLFNLLSLAFDVITLSALCDLRGENN
jgi:hypothetical protein